MLVLGACSKPGRGEFAILTCLRDVLRSECCRGTALRYPGRSPRVVHCPFVLADSLGLMEARAFRGSKGSAKLRNDGIAIF